jgi:hypothetical protein
VVRHKYITAEQKTSAPPDSDDRVSQGREIGFHEERASPQQVTGDEEDLSGNEQAPQA